MLDAHGEPQRLPHIPDRRAFNDLGRLSCAADRAMGLTLSMRRKLLTAWTPEQDEKLREMAAAGAAALQIALKVRHSTMSVRKRAKSLGVELRKAKERKIENLPRRNWPEDRA